MRVIEYQGDCLVVQIATICVDRSGPVASGSGQEQAHLVDLVKTISSAACKPVGSVNGREYSLLLLLDTAILVIIDIVRY
jgi:hypothetical protein